MYFLKKKAKEGHDIIFYNFKLKHPVTWQLSADGSKWIGHMILKKTVLEGGEEKRDSIAILGE